MVLVNGQMRVVIASFEEWYAGQVKYHKVDGSTAPETVSADTASATGLDAETLTKILNNPELATLLKTLADKL